MRTNPSAHRTEVETKRKRNEGKSSDNAIILQREIAVDGNPLRGNISRGFSLHCVWTIMEKWRTDDETHSPKEARFYAVSQTPECIIPSLCFLLLGMGGIHRAAPVLLSWNWSWFASKCANALELGLWDWVQEVTVVHHTPCWWGQFTVFNHETSW